MIPIKDYNRTKSFPFINYTLIIINIIVFIFETRLSSIELNQFILKYGFIPSLFLQDPVHYSYMLITSTFLHGGFMHIIGNMLFLFIFGDNVEDALGHFRYIVFYFLSGIGGTILQFIFTTNPNIPNIGASAAISGVLGAYLVLFPLAKILTIIPVGFFLLNTKLPAYIFLFVWIGMQFLNGIASISVGTINNVAYFAHIGGFSYGFFYTISNRKKFLDRLYFKHKNILF